LNDPCGVALDICNVLDWEYYLACLGKSNYPKDDNR
jgi:hypothetical protein